jgi:hypothetical protein
LDAFADATAQERADDTDYVRGALRLGLASMLLSQQDEAHRPRWEDVHVSLYVAGRRRLQLAFHENLSLGQPALASAYQRDGTGPIEQAARARQMVAAPRGSRAVIAHQVCRGNEVTAVLSIDVPDLWAQWLEEAPVAALVSVLAVLDLLKGKRRLNAKVGTIHL